MPLSRYLANALLDHTFRGVAYPPPAAVYAGLLSTAPTLADDACTELGSFTRQAVAWSAASARAVRSAAQVAPPEAAAPVGPYVAIGFWDASSGGHLLAWAPVPAQTLAAGQPYYWAAGDLVVVL